MVNTICVIHMILLTVACCLVTKTPESTFLLEQLKALLKQEQLVNMTK
jgi:hypothetical protein